MMTAVVILIEVDVIKSLQPDFDVVSVVDVADRSFLLRRVRQQLSNVPLSRLTVLG